MPLLLSFDYWFLLFFPLVNFCVTYDVVWATPQHTSGRKKAAATRRRLFVLNTLAVFFLSNRSFVHSVSVCIRTINVVFYDIWHFAFPFMPAETMEMRARAPKHLEMGRQEKKPQLAIEKEEEKKPMNKRYWSPHFRSLANFLLSYFFAPISAAKTNANEMKRDFGKTNKCSRIFKVPRNIFFGNDFFVRFVFTHSLCVADGWERERLLFQWAVNVRALFPFKIENNGFICGWWIDKRFSFNYGGSFYDDAHVCLCRKTMRWPFCRRANPTMDLHTHRHLVTIYY